MAAQAPQVQWFPGHMAKTRRLIQGSLKLVDLVIEVTDARIPQSSRNPELGKWIQHKPRIVLLNKADAADPLMTRKWIAWYQKQGIAVLACDCKSGKGLQKLVPMIKSLLSARIQHRSKKGMVGCMLRVMVVGVPNVGKSSFINRMAKSKRTRVADRPGVTRGTQWVTIDAQMELLDMPGVLWPKFEDPSVGERLAFTGAVKDDVVDIQLLAIRLMEFLSTHYPHMLESRYGITQQELHRLEQDTTALELLGRKRGMLLSGGVADQERAAMMLLDEFRAGKIGHITLEDAPD